MSVYASNETMHVSGVNPKVQLEGTETNAKNLSIRENAGVTQIYDENSDEVIMTIEEHANRHKEGGGDYPGYYLHINKSGSSEAAGVSGAYGTASTITPDSGYYSILPHLITATVGGTIASGETITVKVTISYDDGTNNDLATKSATNTGDLTWDLTEISGSYVNGSKITSISVAASSSDSSTSATVVGNVKGIEFI